MPGIQQNILKKSVSVYVVAGSFRAQAGAIDSVEIATAVAGSARPRSPVPDQLFDRQDRVRQDVDS